ncbi:MAG: hypothetical protein HKM93_00555 [Desulfobacteraceae bacterium]|nr:hypothetical protein [Desulfobacteraceae bacterium]
MANLRTGWESTEKNPDEDFLKKQIQEENKIFEQNIALSAEASRQKTANISMLLESTGIKKDIIEKQLKYDAERSVKVIKDAEKSLLKPTMDIETMHKQDIEQARMIAKKMKSPGNPHWQGYIWNASYGGAWWNWNGEGEEVPSVTFDVANNRIDPRTQAFGEGWWDADFSKINAYLSFRFTPPSWGHLHIITSPWLHGYYSLYSNDAWYKGEHAKADLDTWVDVHQNFWRSRSTNDVFYMSGDELHPTRSDRIDRQSTMRYYTSVGEGDPVTIRVGAQLYCRGKASGGQARLNFQSGGANYIYAPYVYWYLHN